MLKPCDYQDLPQAAKDLISDEQKTYLDEFTFYQCYNLGKPIQLFEAWYADELLATWDDKGWIW